MKPELAVVIPFVNGRDDLDGALDALESTSQSTPLEAIVVNRHAPVAVRGLTNGRPWVRVLQVEPDCTIPEMRARAFRVATAPSVAVIEDHVRVPPGWARALLTAQTPETPVVGGAVENAATTRTVDWAAFLCEYSHCLPPIPSGSVRSITGNNTIYPRALLERYRGVVESGGWENRLHDAIRNDGIALTCRPDIVVGHKMHYSVTLYLSQRYLYSRSYAGDRSLGLGFANRCVRAASCAVLPVLLLARIISRVWSKPSYRSHLAKSLPLLMLFVVGWAAGEFVGYLIGPGRSLSQVR